MHGTFETIDFGAQSFRLRKKCRMLLSATSFFTFSSFRYLVLTWFTSNTNDIIFASVTFYFVLIRAKKCYP